MGTDLSATGYTLTSLTLLRNGNVVPWPAGTTAWTPVPGWDTGIGNPQNIVNNNEVANGDNRFYSHVILNHVVINAHEPLTFDAYRWITAASGDGRDPIHWRLMVMPDQGGDAFYPVDEQIGFIPTTARGAIVGPFPIVQPAGLNAMDTIPDTSRVRIAQGATFELGVNAIETVGPLSGTGTVALASGAVLGINAFEDALFEGVISGAGGGLTLAGDHAQSFKNNAVISGDFTVDFCGGRFGGLLNVGGALTVTGSVAYAQPASLPATVPLFTFGSIDPTSRDALIAGASSVAAPAGMVVKVTVSATDAVLAVNAPGTILILK
jgi:hypothetical protein